MLRYDVNWDEVAFIIVVSSMVLSPALIALPWAYFTRVPGQAQATAVDIRDPFAADPAFRVELGPLERTLSVWKHRQSKVWLCHGA